jgi:cytoskeletal protein RodZ
LSLGKALREARKASGYSVDQIAEKTRIRVALIKALEAEDFDAAGGLAYARAHIRSIAKTIDADIDLLITEFEKTTNQEERPMIELLEENNATSNRPAKSTHKVSYKFMASVAAVIVGGLVLVPSAASLIKTTTKVSTKAAQVKKTTPSIADVSVPSAAPVAVAAHTSSNGLIVTATTSSSWLWVGDKNGTQIFSGLVKAGTSQTFDSTSDLNVTLGNAGAVTLTLNGKALRSMGVAGEVVRMHFAPGNEPTFLTQKP